MQVYIWEGTIHNIGMAYGVAETEQQAQEQIIKYMENEAFTKEQRKLILDELKLYVFVRTPIIYQLPFGIVTWGDNPSNIFFGK